MVKKLSSTTAFYLHFVSVFFMAMIALPLMISDVGKKNWPLIPLFAAPIVYFLYDLVGLKRVSYDKDAVYLSGLIGGKAIFLKNINSIEPRAFKSQLSRGTWWSYNIIYSDENNKTKRISFNLDIRNKDNWDKFKLVLPFGFKDV